MRVMVVAGGSRGDVQPLVALAQHIQSAGHDVTLAAPRDAEHVVSDRGLDYHRLDVSMTEQMTTAAGRAWIADSAGRPFTELRHMRRVYEETALPLADSLIGLSGRADLFVSGILTVDSLASIAAYDGVAHATALLCPFHPSADGRCGLTAQNPRTRRSNLTRTKIGRWLLARSVTQAGRLVRGRLGMAETGATGFIRTLDTVATVLGASPLLVPAPHDWPSTVTVTGAWTLPAHDHRRPPTQLTDFLEAGPPPVYLGFGSMAVVQPERIHAVALAAARAARVRLILAGTELDGLDGDDVIGVDNVPHEWLFPQVRAVVHHGGAGTTHAALLAGVPQLAVPHIADQPYWGRRVHEAGVGPEPLPLNRLTVDRLSQRLRTLAQSADLVARAGDVGRQARGERGAAHAANTLLASAS